MIFEKNSKLIMIGDSITDVQRARPVGEGKNALGNGYVNLVNAFLTAFYPERRIRVVNMGISGNTVRDLKNRWESDVLNLNPDYVSVLIGINDVWRQCDLPNLTHTHVYIEEYEETYENLIKITKPHVKNMIIIAPFMIEQNTTDDMRRRMLPYQEVSKKLAEKYDLIFVDPQAEFNHILEYYHSSYFAWDRVHPDMTGHLLLAKAFLNAVGFDWQK